MSRVRLFGCGALLLVLVAGAPDNAAGQRSSQILTLGGGVSRYDLYGTKASTYAFILRFDGAIGPYVILEPGAAWIRFKTQFGQRNYLLPEISIQAQGYLGPVRPFIGGGGGVANIEAGGVSDNQFTLHAVSGVRIRLARQWGMRVEVRARSIDPWNNHSVDLTAGIMRVLPGGF